MSTRKLKVYAVTLGLIWAYTAAGVIYAAVVYPGTLDRPVTYLAPVSK